MATKWTDAQKKAIDTSDRDILVSAAAGSGKTAVLVERIIKKVTDKDNPVDIDKIVIVTFTNAAAAEMRYRIRNAIDAKLEQNPQDENLLRQISLINNAKISTIDSFCLNILHNYFSDIDIDPGFRNADKAEITLIENDVMEEMLEKYYEDADEAFMDFVEKYGTGRDDSKVVELILQVYSFARSYPWESEWYDECLTMYDVSEENLADKEIVKFILDSYKQQLKDHITAYEEAIELCGQPDGPNKYESVYQLEKMYMERLASENDFSQFINHLSDIQFGRLPAADKGCTEEYKLIVQGIREKYKKFIENLKKNVFAGDTQKIIETISDNKKSIEMLVKLAREFSERMHEEKKSKNVIDFNDMEHLALNILVKKENGVMTYTEVADNLANAYEEVMIDEYQDSNMLQEVILSAVSKNRFKNKPNNMYMVGDVKQSIYRFRMACPDLFIRKYNTYGDENDECCKIELQNNFRSRENVLESCNDIFHRLMNTSFCGIKYDNAARLNVGAPYKAAPSEYEIDGIVKKANNFGDNSATVVDIITGSTEDNDKVEVEASHIADIIDEIIMPKDGSVNLVFDKEAEGGYRPVSYKDIVVLTRTNKGWSDVVVNTLLSRDIPAFSEASSGYFNLREIQIVLNYLAIVDNPLQDVAFTGAVLSYFGGFDTVELSLIRGRERKKNLYTQFIEMADTDEKVKNFITQLEHYRELSELVSIYELLWKIVYDTGYYDYVKTMPAGDRRQANLDILLQKAAAFEKTSYKGLFNFLRYIERLKMYDDSVEEASLLSENDNLVRVMTIHKSKGLEFPVVILAGMGKQLNFSDAKKKAIVDQELGIGLDYINLERRTKSVTLYKNAILQKNKIDTISEEMRVLYVALTRAREKLFITGMCRTYDKKRTLWSGMAAEMAVTDTYTYAECLDIKTYLDMIMPMVLGSDCYRTDYIELEDAEDKISKYKGEFELNEYEAESIVVADSDNTIENNPDIKASQKEKFNLPEYPYKLESVRKAKVTVTQLKKLQADVDIIESMTKADDVILDESDDESFEELNIPVPKFMSEEENELHGSERGTAYHRVMECLDYEWILRKEGKITKEDIILQIEDMETTKKMSSEQIKCIKPIDILKFTEAEVGKRAARAFDNKCLYREQPFVFVDDEAEDETKDLLVQGVIDMYFVEEVQGEKSITIVDYKTDRGFGGGKPEEVLIKRYKVQLDYYAKALEQLTGIKVKDKIIYSFTLNKEIHL